jgi:hypothetical protein
VLSKDVESFGLDEKHMSVKSGHSFNVDDMNRDYPEEDPMQGKGEGYRLRKVGHEADRDRLNMAYDVRD